MELTPEILLSAYAQGYFPMAESRDATKIHWYYPTHRGILPLDKFHVPTSLAKFIKKKPYRLSMNKDFRAVITACADTPRDKDGTWINDQIIEAYCSLHALGHAHSVEVWDSRPEIEDSRQETGEPSAPSHARVSRPAAGTKDTLIGGLYGVSLSRAFFGESMFSLQPNASKVALIHLVEYLKANDYTLLDTQYVNKHLIQFGVKEIPRAEYLHHLKMALSPE